MKEDDGKKQRRWKMVTSWTIFYANKNKISVSMQGYKNRNTLLRPFFDRANYERKIETNLKKNA